MQSVLDRVSELEAHVENLSIQNEHLQSIIYSNSTFGKDVYAYENTKYSNDEESASIDVSPSITGAKTASAETLNILDEPAGDSKINETDVSIMVNSHKATPSSVSSSRSGTPHAERVNL